MMDLKDKTTISWASIGCGNVCEVKSLPAMYKLPGSQVVGIYSRSFSKATDFASRHKIKTVYASVNELLLDPQIDIVYISTPPDTHHSYTLAALNAGKHVYVEKPMALNFQDALEMHRLAEKQNRIVFVAHYRRGLAYFQQVKSLLSKEAIGKLLGIQMELIQAPSEADQISPLPWRLRSAISGGGYFYDLAPHALDIVAFVLADSFKEVSGFACNRVSLYEAEDSISAAFMTDNGIPGTAFWSFVASEKARVDRIRIVGTEGSIAFSVFNFEPIVLTQMGKDKAFTFENPAHIQEPFIHNILQHLREKEPALCTSKEAINVAWAMDRIMRKAGV